MKTLITVKILFKTSERGKKVFEHKVTCLKTGSAVSHIENAKRFIISCMGKNTFIMHESCEITHERYSDAPMHPDHERNNAPGY